MSVALHDLIHSLTKSEKRFIKLMAGLQKGDKNYLQLFEVIEKQKVYDERQIIRHFKDKAFSKQISVAKNYLMNYILKGLRLYNSSFNTRIELKNLLIDIEIVFSKGQYELTEKLIVKARKLADKYEYPLITEEIRIWEEKVNLVLAKIDKDAPSSNLITVYQNLLDQQELTKQAFKIAKECDKPSGEDIRKCEAILANPLLQSEDQAISFDAKYAYLRTKMVISALVGDQETQGIYCKKVIKLFENNPHQMKEKALEYAHVLHNIIVYSLKTKEYNTFQSAIKKLKSINDPTALVRTTVLGTIIFYELGYYFVTKQFKQGVEVANNIKPEFDKLRSMLNIEDKYIFYYNAAYVFFFAEEYSGALKWENEILNDPTRNFRKDLKVNAMILNILTHYELGNTEMLSYLTNSTLSYLKKNKILYVYDIYFIKMFNNIPEPNRKRELRVYLSEKISGLKNQKSKKTIFPDFDYVEWMEGRLKKIK